MNEFEIRATIRFRQGEQEVSVSCEMEDFALDFFSTQWDFFEFDCEFLKLTEFFNDFGLDFDLKKD